MKATAQLLVGAALVAVDALPLQGRPKTSKRPSAFAEITFRVEYDMLSDCANAPLSPAPFARAHPSDRSVPCGPSARLYVMIASCPVGANESCWDPSQPGQPALPPTDCGDDTPDMPFGYCLLARPTAGEPGTFTTAALQPAVGAVEGAFLLASVYWGNASANASFVFRYGEQEPATRVPITPRAATEATLRPFFNTWVKGTFVTLPAVEVPQFERIAGARVVQDVYVYSPPACAENRFACADAKLVAIP
jgi:hypothetical protein